VNTPVEMHGLVVVVVVSAAAAVLIIDGDHGDSAAVCSLDHPVAVGFLQRTALGRAVVGAGGCNACRSPSHRLQLMIAVVVVVVVVVAAAASQVTKKPSLR
jgi:hypothetical protein